MIVALYGNSKEAQERQFTSIMGAKLTKIDIQENEAVLEFDSGRCLTITLGIDVAPTRIEPKAQLICGYLSGHDQDKRKDLTT
jgi:hypothetical protein